MSVRLALLTLVASLLFSVPALAQEPGVTYDDDSPAGKEYAIPLDTARDLGNESDDTESSGAPAPAGGGTNGSATTDSALFGAGIEPRDGASPNNGGAGAQPSGNSPGDSVIATSPVDSGPSVRTVVADAGSSQLAIGAGLGALAVVAAALAGMAARRTRRVIS